MYHIATQRRTDMKFEPTKSYTMRSVCDHDAVWTIEVVARTAKMVTLSTGKRFRVGVYDGVEFIRPLGTYSMAPILRADRIA